MKKYPSAFAILILGWIFSLLYSPTVQAKNILIMGDSHSVGPFGKTLDAELRGTTQNQIRLEASCGSIIHWWYTGHATPCGFLEILENGKTHSAKQAPTPLISSVLEEFHPHLVIIELGSNYMRGYPQETLSSDVSRLLSDLEKKGIECVWVGPPVMRKFKSEEDAFTLRLKGLVESRCRWIDSRRMTRYPDTGGDGVHYESPGLTEIGIHWAKTVAKNILAPSIAVR